jgi:hypothetical protein
VAVCVVAYAFWRRQHNEKTKRAARAAEVEDSRKYHCVAIAHGRNPCEPAVQLKGKRFLSSEAPILKLDGCNAAACQCRYIHFEDRRQEERRHLYGRYSRSNLASIHNEERRKMPGRRHTDLVDHQANQITDMYL